MPAGSQEAGLLEYIHAPDEPRAVSTPENDNQDLPFPPDCAQVFPHGLHEQREGNSTRWLSHETRVVADLARQVSGWTGTATSVVEILLIAGGAPGPLDVFTIVRPSGASLTRIGRVLSSSHGVVRSRRVTGFWNRPLAGLFGPNVSWKLPDVASLCFCILSPAELEGRSSYGSVTRPLSGTSVPRLRKNLWNAPEGLEAYLNRH